MAEVVTGDGIAMRPFTASLPMALLQARESTMRHFRPMLGEHDLTEQQWRVLRALAASEKPVAIGSLVDRTFLLGPSLSRIVANLEGRGLIVRATATDDLRRSDLSLAPAGRALVQRIAPHSEATYNEIEKRFGKDRLRSLLAELHELATAVTEPSAKSGSASRQESA